MITHDQYHKVVEDAWVEGDARPIAALNKVKEKSITFNQEVFGNIF